MTKTKTTAARPSFSPLTRRQFYARLRREGFVRSPLQMTRTGVTYTKGAGRDRVSVTIPKNHSQTAIILGESLPLTGVMYDTSEGRRAPFGQGFDPASLGMPCFLWVVLALAGGHIAER